MRLPSRPDGRERSKSFKRRADAERWLSQQRTFIAQGDWTDPALGRITFGEYALAWLHSRTDFKPKTRRQYQSLLSLHILPTWRTVPLAKVTFDGPPSGWPGSLGGLGLSGIRQSVFVVSAALDHAVRSGRIRANPARGLAAAITGQHADALIFTVPNGSPLRLSNWWRAVFLPACTRAGISARFRVHDLRRTAASLMVQAGYPPKMLQEIMGHASITTTSTCTANLYPSDMDRYADRLDDAAGEAGTARIRPDDDEVSHG